MKGIHGGDIYRNSVRVDFSVNVNPLGIPEQVKTALHEAVELSVKYPDISAEKLRLAVSRMLSIPQEYLLFGNGASEIFMAAVHAIQPGKIIIPVPSFYGYEHAASAVSAEIIYYPMKKEKQFTLDESFLEVLTEDADLLFLANPNNPTGGLLSLKYLKKLLEHCREKHIYVILDECFIEFCDNAYSVLTELGQYENVLLVRAFTKIFAIPGVRLGYLLCSNQELVKRIERQLPEWNLSIFAQAAGCACAEQEAFVKQTTEYVKQERRFLTDCLRKSGICVYPSETNFLLLYSEKPLYEALLKQGILIRNCANYRGLSHGYYRIAVKSREENEQLCKLIGELC